MRKLCFLLYLTIYTGLAAASNLNTINEIPNIDTMMWMGKQLNNMLLHVPTVYYHTDDTYYTIQDMCNIESRHRSRDAINSKTRAALDDALTQEIQHITNVFHAYPAETQRIKNIILNVGEKWSHKRNRLDTHLRTWAHLANDEGEAIHNSIHSFHELAAFVNDLRIFFKDYIDHIPR